MKKEELEAGIPLATYAAMLELEEQYLDSKVFAKIYPEVRLNFEEFLGLPLAGMQAMELISPNGIKTKEASISNSFKPVNAAQVFLSKQIWS